ncbi:hypothetical protein PsorP6_001288 [Peronosclerospora sorghi]|uniref:Uncharacterized protein n=1 Tax=Peronosclerospora sorghi TaxID=230839 RepID=A0ACC0WWS0_9STRA|nr:hypothetical protein PsorP6_001288 [Peronosclerospora sorghi]
MDWLAESTVEFLDSVDPIVESVESAELAESTVELLDSIDPIVESVELVMATLMGLELLVEPMVEVTAEANELPLQCTVTGVIKSLYKENAPSMQSVGASI